MRVSMRVLCISVAVLLSAGMASAQTALGDVNGDGNINVLDVQASIAQALQSAPQTTPADVDLSGQVDIGDIQNLINTSLATGGLVQRIKGDLAAAANLLKQGVHLAAVSQDGDQVTVAVDPTTGAFTITLPIGKQWSLVFATEPDASGQQSTGTVQFTIAGETSTVLPLPDLSQCDVLNLGTLNFGGQIAVARDIRALLGSINNQDLLVDADGNGIPDFLDRLLTRLSSLPSIGCGGEGEGEGEGEVRPPILPGLPCLDFSALADLIKPCIQGHLAEITSVSLVDDNHNGIPDFVEPFLTCLRGAVVTWLHQEGITIPDSLVTAAMHYIEGALPGLLNQLHIANLVDSHGDGIPDHLRPFLGRPPLPSWLDANGNGIPDVLEHHHPGGGEGEGEGEGEGVVVPDLTGMTVADAQTAIAGAGLIGGRLIPDFSDTVAEGLVIGQHPPVGATVPAGAPVDIVVSKGPRPQPVTVPNVIGMTQADAETAITGAGLSVGMVAERFDATVPAGQVINQVPTAGISIPPGAPVNLAVSKGPLV